MGKFDELMKRINEQYKGKYAAIASDPSAFKMERIPTGILAIDAITYGGLPKGRINMFWGDWSSGKTFTSLKTVARTQRTCKQCLTHMANVGSQRSVIDVRDGNKVLISGDDAIKELEKLDRFDELSGKKNASEDGSLPDGEEKELKSLRSWHVKSSLYEHEYRVVDATQLKCPKCNCTEGMTAVWAAIEDFEPDFARMCGVDLDNLLVVKSEYAEQTIDVSADILRSGTCDLMVIDSVAMMTPSKEITESAEKAQQGLAARLINKALRRWASGQTVVEIESDSGSKPTLLLINQVREKIGVMYGDPSVMPGGKGQQFATSLVLRFRSGTKTKIEDTGETVNHLIHVKVFKSKCCPPDESGEFVIWLRDHEGNVQGTTSEPRIVMEAAVKEGIIERDKSGYVMCGQRYSSQKALIGTLSADDIILDQVRSSIISSMNARRLRHAKK